MILNIRDNASETLREQWLAPGDILSVLMVIGGSIVRQALGQMAGGVLTPVAFSFGWVAYCFEAVLSVVGDKRLMPSPDLSCIVINGSNGFQRQNQSWVLGRILRDHESQSESNKALTITVLRAKENPGRPRTDWVWNLGVLTIVVQFAVASIPLALYRDWSTIFATACGTFLALLGGALPQWETEKWACRGRSDKNILLTRGNGFQHVMLILGGGVGFDLEDLAGGRQNPKEYTRPAIGVLAMCWLVFLITVAGMKEHTWYLMIVGFIGMVQNVISAGAPRASEALGIPLEKVGAYEGDKVMDALMEIEEDYQGVGLSLLPVFFTGELWAREKVFWAAKSESYAELKKRRQAEREAQKDGKDGDDSSAMKLVKPGVVGTNTGISMASTLMD